MDQSVTLNDSRERGRRVGSRLIVGCYPRDLDGLGYHLGDRDGAYAELLRASAPAIEYGSGN
jgi:hypothetical protein